jgi:hypothetical protein
VWLLIEIMNMFNIHSYIDPIESNSRFKVAWWHQESLDLDIFICSLKATNTIIIH